MFKGRDKQGGHLDGYFLDTEDAPIQMPVWGVLKPKKLESLLTCEGGHTIPVFLGCSLFLSHFLCSNFYVFIPTEKGKMVSILVGDK